MGEYNTSKPIPARKNKLVGTEIVKGASGNMEIIKVYELGIQTSTRIRKIRRPGNKETEKNERKYWGKLVTMEELSTMEEKEETLRKVKKEKMLKVVTGRN